MHLKSTPCGFPNTPTETLGERLHLRLDGLNFGLGGRALGLRGRVRGTERQYGGDSGRKHGRFHN